MAVDKTTAKPRAKRKPTEPKQPTIGGKMSFPVSTNYKVDNRGIGKSLSNSISNTAEVIEEFSEDAKKGLRTIGKVFDYMSTEVDGLILVTEAENIKKLVEIGYTPEYALERLETLRAS